jgi:hypothetical protein
MRRESLAKASVGRPAVAPHRQRPVSGFLAKPEMHVHVPSASHLP